MKNRQSIVAKIVKRSAFAMVVLALALPARASDDLSLGNHEEQQVGACQPVSWSPARMTSAMAGAMTGGMWTLLTPLVPYISAGVHVTTALASLSSSPVLAIGEGLYGAKLLVELWKNANKQSQLQQAVDDLKTNLRATSENIGQLKLDIKKAKGAVELAKHRVTEASATIAECKNGCDGALQELSVLLQQIRRDVGEFLDENLEIISDLEDQIVQHEDMLASLETLLENINLQDEDEIRQAAHLHNSIQLSVPALRKIKRRLNAQQGFAQTILGYEKKVLSIAEGIYSLHRNLQVAEEQLHGAHTGLVVAQTKLAHAEQTNKVLELLTRESERLALQIGKEARYYLSIKAVVGGFTAGWIVVPILPFVPGLMLPAAMCVTALGTGMAIDSGVVNEKATQLLANANHFMGAPRLQIAPNSRRCGDFLFACEFNPVSSGLGTHLWTLAANVINAARGQDLQSVPASRTVGQIKLSILNRRPSGEFEVVLPFNLASSTTAVSTGDWQRFKLGLETLHGSGHIDPREVLGVYFFFLNLELAGNGRKRMIGEELQGMIAAAAQNHINNYLPDARGYMKHFLDLRHGQPALVTFEDEDENAALLELFHPATREIMLDPRRCLTNSQHCKDDDDWVIIEEDPSL